MKVWQWIQSLWRFVSELFDDWLTRAAGIVFLLIIGMVFFNLTSKLADANAFLALLVYGMVPVLFVAGGVIFLLAIIKYSGRVNDGES